MSERGATLVELLVTAFLIIVAGMVAGSLIIQSAKIDRAVLGGLRQPELDLALGWVRRDVHAAAGLIDPSVAWSDDLLRLYRLGGGEVSYSALDGQLIRREIDELDAEISTRVVMRKVGEWRWRALTSRLVEVELRVSAGDTTVRVFRGDHDATPNEGRPEIGRALMALRARGTTSW